MKRPNSIASQRGAFVILALTPLTLCLLLAFALSADPATLNARDLNTLEIFAYRDWQRTGIQLTQDQYFTIRAQGEWVYTPGEWNGPEGHRRFRSPEFYPLPYVPGGALIGKIGDAGQIFYVGAEFSSRASVAGPLFLRIDDDILSDNEGKLEVKIEAISGKQQTVEATNQEEQ